MVRTSNKLHTEIRTSLEARSPLDVAAGIPAVSPDATGNVVTTAATIRRVIAVQIGAAIELAAGLTAVVISPAAPAVHETAAAACLIVAAVERFQTVDRVSRVTWSKDFR